MNIYNNTQIEKVCSSNLSNEEKLKILNAQKDLIMKSSYSLNMAINKLENNGYLNKMIEQRDKLVNQFKVNLSIGATSTLSSILLSSQIDFKNTESLYQIILLAGISSIGLFFDTKSIINLIDLKKYAFEIEKNKSYQKRLN